MNKSLKIKFGKKFNKIENSEFIQGTAYIAYINENRNGSYISKETFEAADSSLGLIPIVGNYREDVKLYGGHDNTIDIVGGKLTLKDKTVPYGVVKESHNARWEEVTEEDGTINLYRVCDVVLWQGRYEEAIQSVVDGKVAQSMEINILDGEFNEKDYFDIKSMEYSALCLLGKDINEDGEKTEDNVEPCFESSTIVVSEDFSSNFSAMIEKIYTDKNIEIKKFSVTPQVEEPVVEQVVDNANPKQAEDFALTHDEIRKQLREKMNSTIENDYYYGYWICDVSDNYFVFEDYDDWKYYKRNYLVENNEVVIDMDSEKTEMFTAGWVTKEDLDALNSARDDYEAKIAGITDKYEALKLENETFKQEKLEKEKAKLKVDQDEIFEKFDAKLAENEEYKLLKESKDDFTIVELKKECLAIIGKMALDFKTQETEPKFVTSVIPSIGGEIPTRRYGRWSKS